MGGGACHVPVHRVQAWGYSTTDAVAVRAVTCRLANTAGLKRVPNDNKEDDTDGSEIANI